MGMLYVAAYRQRVGRWVKSGSAKFAEAAILVGLFNSRRRIDERRADGNAGTFGMRF